MIMLGDADTEYIGAWSDRGPSENVNTQRLYVVVEDVDAHSRAKAAGAEIVIDIETRDYSGPNYTTPRRRRQCLDLRLLRAFGLNESHKDILVIALPVPDPGIDWAIQ
jgi:hypothetical protein